jgi:acyl-CoA dehydrogenase
MSAQLCAQRPIPHRGAHAALRRRADEVRRNAIAKLELGKYAPNPREVKMPVTLGC